MKVTIKEANEVEGIWVESEAATYSVCYDAEIKELARAFSVETVGAARADLIGAFRHLIGHTAYAPEFLVEAECNPIL